MLTIRTMKKRLLLTALGVASAALAAGPDGECLLVYEKDAGIDNCAVVARVLREK